MNHNSKNKKVKCISEQLSKKPNAPMSRLLSVYSDSVYIIKLSSSCLNPLMVYTIHIFTSCVLRCTLNILCKSCNLLVKIKIILTC